MRKSRKDAERKKSRMSGDHNRVGLQMRRAAVKPQVLAGIGLASPPMAPLPLPEDPSQLVGVEEGMHPQHFSRCASLCSSGMPRHGACVPCHCICGAFIRLAFSVRYMETAWVYK